MKRRLICIKGEKNGGKTHLMYALCSLIDLDGAVIGGMIQVPSLPHQKKNMYQLSDQHTGEVRTILDREQHDRWEKFKCFFIDQSAFDWANAQIMKACDGSDYLIFDEIGLLELQKGGFYPSFTNALKNFGGRIIFNVRDEFLTQVCEFFSIDENELIVIDSGTDSDSAYERVIHD